MQQQQEQYTVKLKLPTMWRNDVISWFALIESTFRRHGVTDRQFMFDLALPALPEETLDHVKSVLRASATSDDPYQLLKDRLTHLYTPDDLDLTYKILSVAELGDRRPSQLMETMLALLPDGEADGLLFKGVFLSRLPVEIRDNVAVQWKAMDSRALAAFADTLWLTRKSQLISVPTPVSAVDDDGDLVEAVAALNVQRPADKKQKFFKKKGGEKKENKARFHCYKHHTYGKRARGCSDPANCTWSENE
ncbi:MAG: hypothetical protein FJ333_10155 [Sphingomonadales bacterium]|nr:hypothetical protein [Sphingomonadales bacterium]